MRHLGVYVLHPARSQVYHISPDTAAHWGVNDDNSLVEDRLYVLATCLTKILLGVIITSSERRNKHLPLTTQ